MGDSGIEHAVAARYEHQQPGRPTRLHAGAGPPWGLAPEGRAEDQVPGSDLPPLQLGPPPADMWPGGAAKEPCAASLSHRGPAAPQEDPRGLPEVR